MLHNSQKNFHFEIFFSILQVAKTNTAQDVISQALNKSRKDSVGECRIPENYVLVS